MKNSNTPRQPDLVPAPFAQSNIDAKPVSEEAFLSGLALSGAFPASIVVNKYLELKKTADETFTSLQHQTKAVNSGDMRQVEGMLICQAIALQSMFMNLANRAKGANSLQEVQCFTQLALRSQAGSRSTLQTLADVKNPRQVAFVKQTNVANTQQVNNGVMPSSHVENIKATPNELLVEEAHGSTTLDIRAKEEAGRADPAVVTVERLDRPAKRRR